MTPFMDYTRIFSEALPWRLDLVDDLVDGLMIFGRTGHGFGRERSRKAPVNSRPDQIASLISKHLPRDKGAIEERLKFETSM